MRKARIRRLASLPEMKDNARTEECGVLDKIINPALRVFAGFPPRPNRSWTYSESENPSVRHFLEEGYVLFENAVPASLTDGILRDLDAIWRDKRDDVLTSCLNVRKPVATSDRKLVRVLDLYMKSISAREALFCPVIRDFVSSIFSSPAVLFQSLSFETGSQQRIHQDPVYVRVPNNPFGIVAAWIALEDVREEAGPLVFFPRSHLIERYRFGRGRNYLNEFLDGKSGHFAYLDHIESECAKLPRKHFLAKRGDILFWSANLAHGGEKVTNPASTRRSLVGHYCPADYLPGYAWKYPRPESFEFSGGHRFMSKYYAKPRYA